MKKSKLIIFPGYYVPHIGGLEIYVDEFVKYLSKDKTFDIYIFAPNIPKYKEFERRYNNVKVYRYPAFEIIPNYPVPKLLSIKFWRMFFKLYKIDFDIVITQTRFFFNSLIGLIFAKFRFKKKKLVHVEHGSAFVKVSNELTNAIARIYDLTFGKLTFYNADEIIAISRAVKEFIQQNFIRKREIPVIYRGFEIDTIESIKEARDIKEKFKGKIKLCFVGRLYKWKGVENTISAYKQLPHEIKKKTVLIIVGDGEDLERLKKLSDIYLNKGIYFLGKVDFSKAIAIQKTCDIYIHSSYLGGGLSTSLLQAMYCGLGIIASPNEGAKEVIINNFNGILLKDNNPARIRDAIIKLIKNPNLIKKYGKNAKKYIKENFNWKRTIERYKKVLFQVIREN